MSASIEPTTWRRLTQTPMRDIIRGRLTARLDYKSRVDSSTLPIDAKDLINRVVKRTRLWRLEKADVANELIAHFLDGIESGESIDRVIDRFGESKQAARLIRRAKKRQRPVIIPIMRALLLAIPVLPIFYALVGWYLYAGKATPRIDYMAPAIRAVAAIPLERRAWPSYRACILSISSYYYETGKYVRVDESSPDQPNWPVVAEWLDAHHQAIERLRLAAALPRIGFEYGTEGSVNDTEIFFNILPKTAQRAQQTSPATAFEVVAELVGTIETIFSNDARLARTQNNAARFCADVHALLDLADQVQRDDPLVVTGACAIDSRRMALIVLSDALTESPRFLRDDQLVELAHRLSVPRAAADLIDFQAIRNSFYDAVQHNFTDNGFGSGHITREAMYAIKGYEPQEAPGLLDPFRPWMQPAEMLTVSSRRDVECSYNRTMETLEQAAHEPLYRNASGTFFTDKSNNPIESQLKAIVRTPIRPLVIMDRYLGRRDGIVIGIALEMFHRRHGQYPDSLTQLSPQFLPQVPFDRVTGDALHYKLVDGKPIVYSVGADRADNGGDVARYPTGQMAYEASDPTIAPADAVRGDWVIFPYPADIPGTR